MKCNGKCVNASMIELNQEHIHETAKLQGQLSFADPAISYNYPLSFFFFFVGKCISNNFLKRALVLCFHLPVNRLFLGFTYTANEEVLKLSGWNGLYQEGVFMVETNLN